MGEQDDLICDLSNEATVLDCLEVDARCVGIEHVYFGGFGQWKYVFWFLVIEPQQYEGVKLPMFCLFPTPGNTLTRT